MQKKITSALISVFHKDNLAPIIQKLNNLGVKLYSTGGTLKFINDLGIKATPVEDLTGYPSIFGGRVKTLHPAVFGGILYRRDNNKDVAQAKEHNISPIDLTIVDLYPFEETVSSGASDEAIIEKIDIGGVSLIRAAAKNHKDALIVSSREQYTELLQILENENGETTLAERKRFAAYAFNVSSHYDTAIFNYFNAEENIPAFKHSITQERSLRYGENPHQKGVFYGDLTKVFTQLHGKEISYNNLVDIEAAISLIKEFEGETAFAILKHTNACGVAVASTTKEAYLKAFEADTLSAFGGVLISNTAIDEETALEIDKLFMEVLIAPSFSDAALVTLQSKKNRVLLQLTNYPQDKVVFKSLLGGVIQQSANNTTDAKESLTTATTKQPTTQEVNDLLFASKICKHTKSNAIILVKNGQMLASGVGQTSRVDALQQAIKKAATFGFSVKGAALASDAFFPFADSVEAANKAGITSIIQPGGSKKDQDSIDYCNNHTISMVFTGTRHFKH
ncbi:MAG: bifunctional phosphoribosylaminoimidazolecarboxamide formyltransferase/IMP cyclohydrolase [Cyclobacteriaceae bacterium]|nr:bifunctional phosphoribosylaminoimidazolecarboxamide formyltransferase/IMP cyclohydrolase [Cyclobacteriaceae bacterium]